VPVQVAVPVPGPRITGVALFLGVALASVTAPPIANALHFGLTGHQAAPTYSEIDRVRRSGDLPRAESLARQALRLAQAKSRTNRLRFALAVLLVEQETSVAAFKEAATLLEAIPEASFGLADRRWLWLARAYVGTGDEVNAKTAIAKYLETDDRSEDAHELQLALARIVVETGSAQDVADATDPLLSRRVGPFYRAEGYRIRADALRAEAAKEGEEGEKAAKALVTLEQKLLVMFPAEPATRRSGMTLTVKDLTKSQRYRRALNLMEAWEYREAREEFEWLRRSKYRSGSARWRIAEISIFKLRDDMARAREALDTWVRRKDSRFREKATFWAMRAYVKEDKYDEARKLLKVLGEDFQGGEYQERVDFYNAWLWYDQRDCKQAMPLMKLYMDTYRAKAITMRPLYTWCFVRQKRWKRAYRALNRELRKDHPLHRGRALYWQAYVLDKMERREEGLEKLAKLQARFPLSHYGMLGLQLKATWEGRNPRASAQPWPKGGGLARFKHEPGDEAWGWPTLNERRATKFKRVRDLVTVGEIDRARLEYGWMRYAVERKVPKDKRLSFEVFIAHQIEDHKIGWQRATGSSFSNKTGMPDATDADWLRAYPQAYRPLIERLGAKYGIDRAFAYGIMRHESAFEPSAVSHADAVGALQMIKPTALACAKDLGKPFDWRDFAKPRVGFEYSLFYLGKHNNLWSGLLLPNAASYNAGPAPIGRWLEADKGKPTAFVVEEYAYKEARNYTRRVAEHTLRYLYLYEPDPVRRGKVLDALYPTAPQPAPPKEVGY